MLPRSLYELLPYLYLAIGAVSGLMIDSSLIFIASILLISAGVLTIIMRRAYRDNSNKKAQAVTDEAALQAEPATLAAGTDNRSGQDRRKRRTFEFPLTDYAGRLIAQERRRRERRGQFDAGFA